MENEQIKQAFQKVKQDIYYLTSELSNIKSNIDEIKLLLRSLSEDLANQKLSQISQMPLPTQNPAIQQINPTFSSIPAIQHINSAYPINPTQNPTVPQEIEGLKNPILTISTGNKGVPTDKQTDIPTNQQTDKNLEMNIQKASKILNSLDSLKKEIRLKFKHLTNQEMAVFSTIYQLEEQDSETTYKKIAMLLKLSESSIRDYVQRIINKGIPIKKQKINNKKILLSISQDLKKIATLSTIIKLREL